MISREQVDEQCARIYSWLPSLAKHVADLAKRGLSLDVGRYSYGTPKVYFQGEPGRKLTIGNFVSIGPDVKIFVGRQGRHPLDLLSTFPVAMLYPDFGAGSAEKKSRVFAGNLDVNIGNDVWIGANSVVFAGVTIGNGAVIAAGSIVTKDVPAFSVSGGVPARHLKLRFPESIVQRLIKLEWWNLPIEVLVSNTSALFHDSDLDAVVDRLSELVAEYGK